MDDDDDDDDPFGSLIHQCQPTSSQEEKFRNCPFALELEVIHVPDDGSPEPSDTPVEPTGILMVSLPDSSKDESTPHEEEDFQTPSEHSHPPSSSCEEHRPTPAVDAHAGQQINGGGYGDTMAFDNDCKDTERTVDLGKGSDNLGFSEAKSTSRIEGGDGVSGVNCCRGADGGHASEVFESELEKFRGLQGESFKSLSKKLRVSDENLGSGSSNVHTGDTAPMIIETGRNENAGTEVLKTEFEEIGEGPGLGEDTMEVDSPVKESEEGVRVRKRNRACETGEGGSASRSIEEIEKFKYVGCGGIDRPGKDRGFGGRRKLPFSIRGQEKNVEGEKEPGSVSAKNQLLKDLLDALKMVAGELDDGSEDVDFLETAKRRGMTFPRPRWWPPEGFDD